MGQVILGIVIGAVAVIALIVGWSVLVRAKRRNKEYERGLKMVPMLIHLPPATDDVAGNGRDERDVTGDVQHHRIDGDEGREESDVRAEAYEF